MMSRLAAESHPEFGSIFGRYCKSQETLEFVFMQKKPSVGNKFDRERN